MQTNSVIYLGKTVAIQNIDSYSKRDFNKPYRDARIGMLPPKLAQIMINLAGNDASTIYDPFCGTGTVLMEGMLMRKNVVASDISGKLVDFTNKNCEWLQKEYKISAPFRAFELDAQFIDENRVPEKIDAIITESYLGPPHSKTPSEEEQKKIFRELENLHFNWLAKAKKILNKKSQIIMCIPAFKIKGKFVHLPNFKQIISEKGYEISNSFIYDRPDQIVAREIIILKNSI